MTFLVFSVFPAPDSPLKERVNTSCFKERIAHTLQDHKTEESTLSCNELVENRAEVGEKNYGQQLENYFSTGIK